MPANLAADFAEKSIMNPIISSEILGISFRKMARAIEARHAPIIVPSEDPTLRATMNMAAQPAHAAHEEIIVIIYDEKADKKDARFYLAPLPTSQKENIKWGVIYTDHVGFDEFLKSFMSMRPDAQLRQPFKSYALCSEATEAAKHTNQRPAISPLFFSKDIDTSTSGLKS
jgi:hypothetical protein